MFFCQFNHKYAMCCVAIVNTKINTLGTSRPIFYDVGNNVGRILIARMISCIILGRIFTRAVA